MRARLTRFTSTVVIILFGFSSGRHPTKGLTIEYCLFYQPSYFVRILKPIVKNIVALENVSRDEKLLQICTLLNENISHYNWVGFYFANHDTQTLHLGPYVGEPTDHTVIPFGKGICGQVAVSNETFVVPDVWEQDNYLACSLETKAEIVVPIIKDGEISGAVGKVLFKDVKDLRTMANKLNEYIS